MVFEDVAFDNNRFETIYYGKYIVMFGIKLLAIKYHILKHHVPELRSCA